MLAQACDKALSVEIVAMHAAVGVKAHRVDRACQPGRQPQRVAQPGYLHLVGNGHGHAAEIGNGAQGRQDFGQRVRRRVYRHHHMVEATLGKNGVEYRRRADMVGRMRDRAEDPRGAGHQGHRRRKRHFAVLTAHTRIFSGELWQRRPHEIDKWSRQRRFCAPFRDHTGTRHRCIEPDHPPSGQCTGVTTRLATSASGYDRKGT